MIERAFATRGVSAVALAINCPGGSAMQSAMIAARIRRLSAEKKIPVVAFCADVAASGGYWLACAADEIYADASSIVGSIGVIAASFGFCTTRSHRLGIERRVHTAGELKSFWDPFRPEQEQDVARLRRLQDRIHHQFIEWVKERRGSRLAGDRDLFTGEFWVGDEALGLGLVDGIGHLAPTMRPASATRRGSASSPASARFWSASACPAPTPSPTRSRRAACSPASASDTAPVPAEQAALPIRTSLAQACTRASLVNTLKLLYFFRPVPF